MADKVASKTETERQINLSVLRKHDNNIDQIIDTAVSVAQYKFNASPGVWEKTEVEGSLFLYSRTVSPYVILFIMNRLNKRNTKLVLTSDMEFKVQEPFLLCKASNNEINGIWFYDQTECKRFGTLLSRLAVIAKDESSLKIAVLVETQKRMKVEQEAVKMEDGILGMFSRAQEEFKKSREKHPQVGQYPSKVKQKQQHGGKESSQKNVENTPKQEKLQKNGHVTKSLTPKSSRKQEMKRKQEEYQERHAKDQETLMKILHVGEHKPLPRSRTMSSTDEVAFDDQHKDINDFQGFRSQAGDLAVFDKLGIIQEMSRNHGYRKDKVIDCAALESSLLDNSNNADIAPPLHTVRSMPDFGLSMDRKGDCDEKPFQSATNVLPLPFGATSSTLNLLSPTVIAAKFSRGRGTSLDGMMSSHQRNAMIGANFGTPTRKTAKKLFPDDEKSETKFPDAPSNSSLSSLMSPAAFLSKSNPMRNENENELTKEQFQEALIYMIKNDTQFVSSLHAAYVEVRKKR